MSRLYINASNVLDKLNTKGGLKTLVFSSKIGGNKKKLYALVCETLKYKIVMDEMLDKCKIKKRLMEMYRPNFLYVMLYDLIFGRGIEGGGKMKRELKKHEEYETCIEKHYDRKRCCKICRFITRLYTKCRENATLC